MTPLLEGVGIALDSLRANKARAALTILGVAIGVTVVMVIAAMISGINKSVSDIFEQIAPRTFLVWRFFQAGVVVNDGSENAPWRRNPPISDLEVARIAGLPSVRYVTSREESQTAVEFEDRRLESVFLAGLSSQWLEVNGGDVYPGRDVHPHGGSRQRAGRRHQREARDPAVPRPRPDRPGDQDRGQRRSP